MSALAYTCRAMVSRDCSACEGYSNVGIEANLVHETVKSLRVENSLHFTEDRLDGIEFGAVGYAVDWSDVKPLVPRQHFSTFVYS